MSDPQIVIVEDNDSIASLYRDTLSIIGLTSTIIRDGQIAYDTVVGMAPKLILLDMNLPNINGDELLKRFRAEPKLAEIPIIIATANAMAARMLESEAGPHDYILVKPLDIMQMQRLVRRLLGMT